MNDSQKPRPLPPPHVGTLGHAPYERPSGAVGDFVGDLSQRAPGASTIPPVELNIEQLVLHGFPARDRHRIARAMQLELARLLTENGVPASLTNDSSLGEVDAGDIRLAAHARPETLGTRIAQSVYRGMRQ